MDERMHKYKHSREKLLNPVSATVALTQKPGN